MHFSRPYNKLFVRNNEVDVDFVSGMFESAIVW